MNTNLKRTLICGAALCALGASTAYAHDRAALGISVGIAGPGYALQFADPAPVYYAPPPVVYAPARIYAPPVYYAAPPPVVYRDYGPGWKHRHRHGHWRYD